MRSAAIGIVHVDALGPYRTVFPLFVEWIEHRDDTGMQNALGLADFENRIVGRPSAEDGVARVGSDGRSGEEKKCQSEASLNHR